MIDPAWRVEGSIPTETSTDAPPPVLVTMHFLLATLRRRWRIWVGLGCVGLLLGVGWVWTVPAKNVGTVTLLLAHDPLANPEQAMSTDLSLLRTRTVATMVIDRLDLDLTPQELQESITEEAPGSSVLIIEVLGPDEAAARQRARVLGDAYLEFRSRQIRAQANALIEGYVRRVEALRREWERLGQQYEALNDDGPAGRGQAVEVLAQRAQVDSTIRSFEQTIQDTTLKTGSIVTASQVLDPASVLPASETRRWVVGVASGLLAGTAAGMGLVLLLALASDRLRRREEVALAIDAPVRFSVGDLRRRGIRWGRRRRHTTRDLGLLVEALASELAAGRRSPRKPRPARWALATVDEADASARVVGALARELARRGLAVFVVDLSRAGGVEGALKERPARKGEDGDLAPPVLFRPDGVAALARGPRRGGALEGHLRPEGSARFAWDSADVVLTFAEVDPALGVDHLTTWADQALLLVMAGRSSAERLRTTAELFRAAGLPLRFAIMTGADRNDESLGLPGSSDPREGARSTS